MYDFKILKEIDPINWNKDITKSSYSNFFQSGEYLVSQGNSKEKFPLFIYIFDSEKTVKGQLGVIVQKSPLVHSSPLKSAAKIVSALGNRVSWAGGPVIHSDDKAERIRILQIILKALDKIADENRVILVDGYSPPQDVQINDDYVKEFKKNNYAVTNFLTYVTDLSKRQEEIWNSLTKNAKRDVTRAGKRNIVVKELDYEQLDDFFQLSKMWAETKGISKSIPAKSKKDFWNYYQKGIEKIFLAYEDNELVASHRLGCFNGIVYSHSIVNSYSKPGSLGGPYLTWYALKWAKDHGMKIYDFSGGQAPNKVDSQDPLYEKQWKTLLAYKKKWGGKEFPYFHFSKVRKKSAYKIMRAVLRLDWTLRDYKKSKYTKKRSS